MTDRERIAADWAARGFSCDLWTDPPGQRWEDFTHATDEVVMVLLEGPDMRSQIRFVMHDEDEHEFVQEVLAEPGTVFVNGPKWATEEPPVLSRVEDGDGFYQMIWNPGETLALTGKHYAKGDEESWYCENEFLTLQFLRSGAHASFLGRLLRSACSRVRWQWLGDDRPE
jgi:hypothetical protein